MAHSTATRLRQLQRVLALIELIGPLRYGATIHEINADLAHEIGLEYSTRTIHRDLLALEEMGLVECRIFGHRLNSDRWLLVTNNFRSQRLFKIAEERAEADEYVRPNKPR